MNAQALADSEPVLRMTGITKSYGAVHALRGVDFDLRRGEVMALLGENGAGKSTLVKILSGLESADGGTVLVNGQEITTGNQRVSRDAGIAVAEQEISVIGPLSAAENIFLGGIPFKGAWSKKRLAQQARGYLDAVGLDHIDPNVLVESLSVAERQLIEIARLLARDAQILILDEPTAALSDVEIERILKTVVQLARSGRSIVYVTHRLGEVFEIGDRVTVLRGGKAFAPQNVSEMTVDGVIELMIGRKLEDMYPERAETFGDVRLRVAGLIAPQLTQPAFLEARAGEIVGIAGQMGSGAGSLLRAIAGSEFSTAGTVLVGDVVLPPAHRLVAAMNAGIGFCSSDRKLDGIFADLAVTMNLTAPALRAVSPGGIVRHKREVKMSDGLADQVAFNRERLGGRVSTLSGGNQQKVALGKWLGIDLRVLLVQEPTRGVDVGARAEIYAQLRRLADEGLAIVFASSDLEEVLGLSDTVVTMFRGRMIRTVPAATLTAQDILRDITHPMDVTA